MNNAEAQFKIACDDLQAKRSEMRLFDLIAIPVLLALYVGCGFAGDHFYDLFVNWTGLAHWGLNIAFVWAGIVVAVLLHAGTIAEMRGKATEELQKLAERRDFWMHEIG